MGDSDNSYDFYSVGLFVDELRGGADLVMGQPIPGGIFGTRYHCTLIWEPMLSGGRILYRTPIGIFLRFTWFQQASVLDWNWTLGMEFASGR
jgi:hypothetical protein